METSEGGGGSRAIEDGLQTRAVAELDDRELLARFVEGRDGRAFAGLVDRHGRMALGVCRRILGDSAEADDAFQATFLVLIDRAESLHRSPVENRSLGGWLYRVAANAAYPGPEEGVGPPPPRVGLRPGS